MSTILVGHGRNTQEEDAAELKLGPDFTDAETLLASEVAVWLKKRQDEAGDDPEMELNNP